MLPGRRVAAGSERELADFFENAPVGVHWVGPNGVVVRANQVLLDMLGYRREEYVGHSVAEFHVDSDACKTILRHLQHGGELHGHQVTLRCKDGSIRHALIDSNVRRENGRFIHTRCVFRDITDRKCADLLAQFFGNSGGDYNIVVRFDGRDLNVESAGEGFTRVTGYAAEEFTAATAPARDSSRRLSGHLAKDRAALARRTGQRRSAPHHQERRRAAGFATLPSPRSRNPTRA